MELFEYTQTNKRNSLDQFDVCFYFGSGLERGVGMMKIALSTQRHSDHRIEVQCQVYVIARGLSIVDDELSPRCQGVKWALPLKPHRTGL